MGRWEQQQLAEAMAEAELDLAGHLSVNLVSAFLAMEPLACLISLARVCGGGSVTEGVQRFIWDNCISKANGSLRVLKWVSFLFPDDCPGAATCLRSRKMVIPLQCSLNMLEGDTGVGLVGICLVHVRASKVTLSDGDLSSLANMKLNLGMNELSVGSDLLEANTQEKNLSIGRLF